MHAVMTSENAFLPGVPAFAVLFVSITRCVGDESFVYLGIATHAIYSHHARYSSIFFPLHTSPQHKHLIASTCLLIQQSLPSWQWRQLF